MDKIKTSDDSNSVYSLDISDIEKELILIVEDIRFSEKYPKEVIDSLKELFNNNNLKLIIFNSNMFEYYPSMVFDDVFFIGVPISLMYEEQYVPLVWHEIGHYFYEENLFTQFDSLIKLKIEDIENQALNPPTRGHTDKTLLAKSEFLKRVIPDWKKEFFADLFAASIRGTQYVHSFAMFQLDKAYLCNDESDPPHKLRFEVILKFLEKEDIDKSIIEEISKKYNGLIHTDSILEAQVRGIIETKEISALGDDFGGFVSSYEVINAIKEELKGSVP